MKGVFRQLQLLPKMMMMMPGLVVRSCAQQNFMGPFQLELSEPSLSILSITGHLHKIYNCSSNNNNNNSKNRLFSKARRISRQTEQSFDLNRLSIVRSV